MASPLRKPPLGPAQPLVQKKAPVVSFRRFKEKAIAKAVAKGAWTASLAAGATSMYSLGYALPMPASKVRAPVPRSGGGGGGTTAKSKFVPRWNFSFGGGYAPWNLLANAAVLKPIGKKFVPDPDYKGNGECPPQPDGMSCPVNFDNVVEMNKIRAEYRRRTMHSQRARGSPHVKREVTVPTGSQSATVTVLLPQHSSNDEVVTWDPVEPRYSYRKASEAEKKVEKSMFDKAFLWYEENDGPVAGDTAEKRRKSMRIQGMFYLGLHLMNVIEVYDHVKLSPSMIGRLTGQGDVEILYYHIDGYEMSVRMTVEEFCYRVDCVGDVESNFEWEDDTPRFYTEEYAYDLFDMDRVYHRSWDSYQPTPYYGGFYNYKYDLEKYFDHFDRWLNGSLKEEKFEYVDVVIRAYEDPSYVSGDAAYYDELEAVALLRDKHRQLVNKHMQMAFIGKPRKTFSSEEDRWESYWVSKLKDDEVRRDYVMATNSEPVTVGYHTYVTGSISKPEYWTSLKHKVKSSVKGVIASAKGMFGMKKKKPVVIPVLENIEPSVGVISEITIEEKVPAVSDAILLQFLANRVHSTDREDELRFIRWLDPSSEGDREWADLVTTVIKAVEQDNPDDEYSEGGIYLGKKPTRFERTESGIILVENNAPAHPVMFDSSFAYRELWEQVRKQNL